jgi:outer membrane protein
MRTLPRRANGLTALIACLHCACATSQLKRAPSAPDVAWKPASNDPHDFSLPAEPSLPLHAEEIATAHPDRGYTLPELINIAESANPDTRIGWERARQAALAVGIAKAEYLPVISAWALAGYRHHWFPVSGQSQLAITPGPLLPGVSTPIPPTQASGHVGIDTLNFFPFLAIRWQIVDFGRGPTVDGAEHASDAINAAFTAKHQQVVFDVTRAYLRLSAARAQTAVARDALERTRAIAKGAEGRYAQGIATTVEVTEARREVASAEYNVVQAEAAETTVYTALLSTMGLDPVRRLSIASNPSRELPAQFEGDVQAFVQSALKTRPDLQAALSQRASAQALISKSQSAYLPRLSVIATGGASVLKAKIDGGPFSTTTIPNIGAIFNVEWLLFDGGVREAQVEISRSRRNEAEQELEKLQRDATQQVVNAYNELNASLAQYRAALALEKTSSVAEDATTKSYANGLSTFTDVNNAQKAHSLASATKEQAFAQALISAAALTFATGQLGSAKSVPNLVR